MNEGKRKSCRRETENVNYIFSNISVAGPMILMLIIRICIIEMNEFDL